MDSPRIETNVVVDAPSREEVQATIEAAVAPVRTDLKWLRYCMLGLLAATASPKLGGPTLPDVAAHVVQRVFA